ncbi:hypothetical protein [Photorhabdus australis]|nr:hypothetical protein [Photorhabdus australis]
MHMEVISITMSRRQHIDACSDLTYYLVRVDDYQKNACKTSSEFGVALC